MPQSEFAGDENAVEVEIREVDELGLVLPAARLDLARVNRGTEVAAIRSSFHDGVSGHVLGFGFTVLGGGAVDDSSLALGAPVVSGTTPTLWEGAEASVGDVSVFGPGSVHQCVDAEGLVIEVLCMEYESLRETADVLGVDIGDWDNRQAWLRSPGWPGGSILDVGTELDPDADASALLSSVALTLASASFDVGSRRALSSTQIVGRCFEYLDATGSWFPSIAELCEAGSVSERSLRRAFIGCFDRPPSQVLRARALSSVEQVLRDGTPHTTSVTDVAINHGFRHVSDFARHYRLAFGETPSKTLRTKTR